MKKIYLIDGMSLVFRAYHAMFRTEMSNKNGEPTGAIFGFTNILTSLMEKEKAENLAVIFDTSEPTFRHIKYPEYKANRDAFPEDLGPQLEKIKEMLTIMGIPQYQKAGFEADDIIGTLAKEASAKDIDVICLTSDKDYYQLVDDKIKILKPAHKGPEMSIVDYAEVEEKFGVHPDKVIDVLALIGDSSDNVPGVKGVGIKTAIPLVQEYGNVEGIYENIDKITRKAVKTKLENDKELAFLSKELVTIDTKVPMDFSCDECNLNNVDYKSLDAFFAEQGFTTIRAKWRAKAGADFDFSETEEEVVEIKTIKDIEKDYIFVNSFDKLDSMLKDLSKAEILSFDLETDSLDRQRCNIVGIALAAEEGKAYYIPTDERIDNDKESASTQDDMQLFAVEEKKVEIDPNSLSTNEVLEKVKSILEDKDLGKCGQNIKFDAFILKRYGIDVHPMTFDSMLAHFILEPEKAHNLDALAEEYLAYTPISITTLIGADKKKQKSMREVPQAEISDYACEDADIALKLCNILKEKLEEENLLDLAEKVEFPMLEVLTEMEYNGVSLNSGALNDLSKNITKRAEELTKLIHEEAGQEFNVDSPSQLGTILFEKMQIPPVKKTKTGYSTDVSVLTKLSGAYPIADYVLEYRTLTKLISTYVNVLPKLVNEDTSRIHTSYNQAVAQTGRLSSTDPNLQNIPIRTDLGKEIRKAFVPKEGTTMLAADYSQVELRIMAFICGDQHMIDAFKNNYDIHAATAAILFDKEIEEVDADMRRVAKTVNFGIMYGLGSFGLSERLSIGRAKAKEIIDNYFEKYPGIRKYIDMTIEAAREKGYAETLCSRRRNFPEINAKNANLRKAAERAAINMPIQGTASDMMKIAMIDIHKAMKEEGLKSKMLLQVHDEIVFEVENDELEKIKQLVTTRMEAALPLGEVPVVVDIGIGNNWFEAH